RRARVGEQLGRLQLAQLRQQRLSEHVERERAPVGTGLAVRRAGADRVLSAAPGDDVERAAVAGVVQQPGEAVQESALDSRPPAAPPPVALGDLRGVPFRLLDHAREVARNRVAVRTPPLAAVVRLVFADNGAVRQNLAHVAGTPAGTSHDGRNVLGDQPLGNADDSQTLGGQLKDAPDGAAGVLPHAVLAVRQLQPGGNLLAVGFAVAGLLLLLHPDFAEQPALALALRVAAGQFP